MAHEIHQVFEATWEELVSKHAPELAGRRLRVVILPEETVDPKGWPKGFFEETFGSVADDPIERLPQGKYDRREPIS